MKLTVTNEFARAVAQVHAATESKRSTLPILDHLLVKADAASQTVSVSGTNLHLSVRRTLPAEVQTSGSRAILGDTLTQILHTLPDEEKTSLELLEDEQIQLLCLRSQFRLKTLGPDEFPVFPTVPSENWLTVPASGLADLVRKTAFATCKDESRPALQGVSLRSTAQTLIAAATNGHRLAVTKCPHANGKVLVNILIPPRALEAACRFGLEGSGDLAMGFTEGREHLVLARDEFVVATQLIDTPFPEYESAIPADSQHGITVSREALKTALKGLVPLIGQLKHVRCTGDPAKPALELLSQDTEYGEGRIELDAEISGAPDPFYVSPVYLLDFLDKTGTDRVRFHLKSPLDPIRVESIGDPDYTYLVMPMRGN